MVDERHDEAIHAFERAYAGYVERSDNQRAALCALALRRVYLETLNASLSTGWLARAERILAGELELPAHSYLVVARTGAAWNRGDLDEAFQWVETAVPVQIGGHFDDRDLQA